MILRKKQFLKILKYFYHNYTEKQYLLQCTVQLNVIIIALMDMTININRKMNGTIRHEKLNVEHLNDQ